MITSLKRADEIPVAVPVVWKVDEMAMPAKANATTVGEITQAVKPKLNSAPAVRKKQAKGRKQLYTHVKTKQGSVIHAVLGKDKVGEWRTPALCGATPARPDGLGIPSA